MIELSIRPQNSIAIDIKFNDVEFKTDSGDMTVFNLSSEDKINMTLKYDLLRQSDYESLHNIWTTKRRTTDISWMHPLTDAHYLVRIANIPKFGIKAPSYYSAEIPIRIMSGIYYEWELSKVYVIGNLSYIDNGVSQNNYYYCKLGHTSTANDKPETGINWATYWTKRL